MYRIELAPGEETVYRTIEELAVGFRNGLVTSRSRIYHNATQKWLPIEFHPHYKKAIELSAHRQDLPSAAPLPESLNTLNFAVQRQAIPVPPAARADRARRARRAGTSRSGPGRHHSQSLRPRSPRPHRRSGTRRRSPGAHAIRRVRTRADDTSRR